MKTHRKISNRFREILKQELQIWQADGIISPEQSGALSQKYQLDEIQKESRNLLLFAIYFIGAVLVGAGIISFVAAHWEAIPAAVKVAMVVAFMVIGHSFGYYLWQISGKSPRLGHALIVLGTLVFGANIGLMAQIFHIKSNFYNGLFAWAIGALIMAYAAASVPNAFISIVVWFIGFCAGIDDHQRFFAFLPFVAAVVFLTFSYFNRSILIFSLSLLAFGVTIIIYTGTAFPDDIGSLFTSFGLAATGLALFFFGFGFLSKRIGMPDTFNSSAMAIAIFFGAVSAYVLSFKQHGLEFPELFKEYQWLYPTIVIYFLGVVLWLVSIKQIMSDAKTRLIAAGLFISVILVAASVSLIPFLMTSPDSFWCTVFANLACLVLASAVLVSSFLLLDRRIFWAGVLYLALIIASRFLEYETGLLLKAIIFITCGICLILAGVGFESYIKHRRSANA